MGDDRIRIVQVNATFAYKLCDQIESESSHHGSLVFKGLFNGTIPIVLKRSQKVDERTTKDVKKDLDILASPENRHPNFIRYYGHTSDDNFSYLATELCECSVADIVDPKRKDKAQVKTIYFEAIVASLPKKEILRQSSEAVSFLHRPQWNMIHRNLHPDNFLIACVDPNKDYFLIKLTDFQLSKSIEKNPQNTGTLNKEGWVAPESFKDTIELDNKVDAFILGCYYFYVLSGGNHPFGSGVVDQRTRIKDGNDKVYQDPWDGKPEWDIDQANMNEKEEAKWALEMIKGLIKYNPNDRQSVDDVLKSKYFQPEPYVIYDHPTSLKAGLCVILTQSKYHNDTMDVGYFDDQGAPKGIEIDSKTLENTFSHFGYHVLHFKNLRARETVHFLSPEQLAVHAGVSSLDEFASLIICVLGHGEKDVVIGVDGTPVTLNRLQYAFNDVLNEKPKIFVILSCRGDHNQLILDRNDHLFNPPTVSTVTLRTTVGSNRMPPLIDFLSLMSSMEEFQTYLDPGMGSEFITALCDSLRHEYNVGDSSNKKDLVQLFGTVVIPRVGRSGMRMTLRQANGLELHYIIKQTPECRSSLTKAIRFKATPAPRAAKLIYDGEYDDPCFLIGREYFKNLRLAYPIWQTPESRTALSNRMTELRRTDTFSLNSDVYMTSSSARQDSRLSSVEPSHPKAVAESSVSLPITKTAGAWIRKDKMRYNKEEQIYDGGKGIFVFRGFFGGDQPAVIKRFQIGKEINESSVKQEADLMLKANGHENILRYFDYEMDEFFLYLATESCIGTLQDLIEKKIKTELGTPSFFKNEKEILLQVTEGLAHLHSPKISIIHRDVKPTNLLIYQPEGMTAVMKVADFGISKMLKPDQTDTTNSSKTNPSGTRGWISPEQYQPGRYSCKVDIFALGLVFGYMLSDGGKHPYGEDIDKRAVRVKDKEETDDLTKNYFKDKYSGDGLLLKLIVSMLQMDPEKRPTAEEVLKNPFLSNIQ